jgi:hypothetical protein
MNSLEARMDRIRLASEAEVASIAEKAWLTPPATVLAFGEEKPDLAVYRMAPELDPVYFAEDSNTKRRAIFVWGIENGLRMQAVFPHYYFNVAVADKAWQEHVEHWGATRVSGEPEYRYLKRL